MKKIIFGILSVIASISFVAAQDTIRLRNPSFEGLARCCQAPQEWESLDFPGQTPPDVQPGFFGVNTKAFDGDTYLGMVTREDGTYESVFQALDKPLIGGQCYKFTIYLCSSGTYYSGLRSAPNIKVRFYHPAKLVILAGNSTQDSLFELMAVSKPVTNNKWKSYSFEITPTQTYNYLLFSAFYEKDDQMIFNGNILLDHISDIVPCPIKED